MCRRVPNELPQEMIQQEGSNANQTRMSNRNIQRTIAHSNDNSTNSERTKEGNRVPEDTVATLGSHATFQSRLWTALFQNVNRSIDELYQLCDEQGEEEMCLEAMDMFERSGRDFKKLAEKMEVQRKFVSNQSSGAVWEVGMR